MELIHSKYCGYQPQPPIELYQRWSEGLDCSTCLKCPPHPADVPEEFPESCGFEPIIRVSKLTLEVDLIGGTNV